MPVYRQHFHKIKKTSSKTPSTPRKGAAGVKSAGVSKTPTSKRKLAQMNDDRDDEEIIMTPSKSLRAGYNRTAGESAQESKKAIKVEIKNEQTAHICKTILT